MTPRTSHDAKGHLMTKDRLQFAVAAVCSLVDPAAGAAGAAGRAAARHHQRQNRADADCDPAFCRRRRRSEPGRRRYRRRRFSRSRPLGPVPAARPEELHPGCLGERRHPAPVWRLAPDQCAGAGDGLGADPGRRQPAGRVPAVGRLRRAAADRVRLHDDAAELAPRRPYHRRRDLQADHRRGRLFRHPHRLCRRVRAGREARQAPRHHGPGQRQQPVSDRWPGIGADPAIFADRPGDHLPVLCERHAARLSAEYRYRAAGGDRRVPRHDLRAALFARRQSA